MLHLLHSLAKIFSFLIVVCCINHCKFGWIEFIFFFFFRFLLIHYLNNLNLMCHIQILSAMHYLTPFLFHDDTTHHCIEKTTYILLFPFFLLAAEMLPVFNCTHTSWQLKSYRFSLTHQAGSWKATSFCLHLTLAAEKLPVSHPP